MQFLRTDAGARSVTVALTDVLRKVEAPASNLLHDGFPAISGGLSTTHPSERSMNALPNTRDAIGDSWSTTSRRARRMARHGREAAEDIGSELRTLLSELESTLSEGTSADAAALRAQISERLDNARARLNDTHAALRERAGAAFGDADAYLHEKPWQTIALVGGLALVAGVLLARVR